MMLADLGADVIKVERPDTGDDTRGWGPPFNSAGESAYFLSVNRNKLSITLDFANPGDRDLLLELVNTADVVVENFLPGKLKQYGIDGDALLAQSGRLIWCTISGFGPTSTRPGYDFVVQAEAGWMAITGPADGPPSKVGVALADVVAGKDAAAAVLAALIGREHLSAPERHLHVSLMASATAALINVAQNTLVSGQPAQRWGNAHPNLVPYQLFDTADRPLVLAVGTDAQWAACAQALDLPAHVRDGRWHTNADRVRDREPLVTLLANRFLTAPSSHWLTRLSEANVPCGRVREVGEVLADSTAFADPIFGLAPATSGLIRRRPPSLGEHNEVVQTLGWSAFSTSDP